MDDPVHIDRALYGAAVARALKAMRQKRGLTRDQVARKVERKESTVYRWENSLRTPSVKDLVSLASVYDVEPSAFFPDKAVIEAARQSIERDANGGNKGEEGKDADPNSHSHG